MQTILAKRFEEIGLNVSSMVLAESVLRMIEDAGMQPPEKWTTRIDTPFGELVFPNYKWEEE
jgi:hypothetical protein